MKNVDGLVDVGEAKNGSFSSVEKDKKNGSENFNGSASVLGVDKNDENGVENIAAGDPSSLFEEASLRKIVLT